MQPYHATAYHSTSDCSPVLLLLNCLLPMLRLSIIIGRAMARSLDGRVGEAPVGGGGTKDRRAGAWAWVGERERENCARRLWSARCYSSHLLAAPWRGEGPDARRTHTARRGAPSTLIWCTAALHWRRPNCVHRRAVGSRRPIRETSRYPCASYAGYWTKIHDTVVIVLFGLRV